MNLSVLKILMVEDDPVNKTLANHLFKKIGCNYSLSETGIILADEIKQVGYDLIFIDIETADGLSIITRIRSYDASMPIVGMTIDANNPLLHKCMEAGMNAYILKPLTLDVLTDKMNAIMRKANSIDEPYAIFNFEKFYLTCGNNKATAKNIIDLFLAHTPDNMKQLEDFLQGQDWENLKNLSHRIKVVYSLMGLRDVKNYFDEIEKDITTNTLDTDKFNSYLAVIKEQSNQLIKELKEVTL